MRLIDADALLEKAGASRLIIAGMRSGKSYLSLYRHILRAAVDSAPTVDAVHVVRCKDCKYGHDSCGDIACYHTEYDLLEGVLTHGKDFYCSYGERKGE